MKIYLIRHGETSWNTLGRLQGRTDIELNENGIRLAKITGEKLKDVHFDLAIASPLKRAYETAGLVLGERNIPILTDERIEEISFGEWEMKSWDELSSDPRSKAWFNDWINIPAPSGESLQDQYNRVSHFLDEIRRSSLQKVCLFTHGGVLICAHVYAGKYDLKEAFRNVPSYGTVIKLELD